MRQRSGGFGMSTHVAVSGIEERRLAPITQSGTADAPAGRRISVHQSIAEFIALDCLLLVLCGLLPLEVRGLLTGNGHVLARLPEEVMVIPAALVLFIAGQKSLGGYRTQHLVDRSRSVQRLLLALIMTFSVLMAVGAA